MTQPSNPSVVASSPIDAPTGSDKTASATIGSLTDGILVVELTIESGVAGRTITGVTWNGSGLTLAPNTTVEQSVDGGAGYIVTCIFYLLNPAAATANIVATVSGGGTFVGFQAWTSNNASGVTGGTTGSSATSSLTPSSALTSTSNDIGVAHFNACNSNTAAVSGSNVQIGSDISENPPGSFLSGVMVSQYNTGANPTMSMSYGANSGLAWSALVIQGTGGGGGSGAAVERLIWMM